MTTYHYYVGRNGTPDIQEMSYSANTLSDYADTYFDFGRTDYESLLNYFCEADDAELKDLKENWGVNIKACRDLAIQAAEAAANGKHDDFNAAEEALYENFSPYPQNEDTIYELVSNMASSNSQYVLRLAEEELDYAKEHDVLFKDYLDEGMARGWSADKAQGWARKVTDQAYYDGLWSAYDVRRIKEAYQNRANN